MNTIRNTKTEEYILSTLWKQTDQEFKTNTENIL